MDAIFELAVDLWSIHQRPGEVRRRGFMLCGSVSSMVVARISTKLYIY